MSPHPVCRACASTALQPVLRRNALDLLLCQACTLVQARSAPPASSAESIQLSSTIPGKVEQSSVLARRVIAERRLTEDSLVIESGSNDGSLLRHYRVAGVPVLGIEPSQAASRIARQRHGIPTRETPFTRAVADRLVEQGLHCDVFHAHDVLSYVEDLHGFLHGIRAILKEDGVAVIETDHVKELLERDDPDGIDPRRIFHFSLTSLSQCLIAGGLIVEDVECGPTMRVYAVPALPNSWPRESVVRLLAEEEEWGVRAYETYAALGRRAA